MAEEKIRESVIAGSWYPGNPGTLRREIETYLDQADVPPVKGDLIGLVVPHAGYMYSGSVAAHAYKLLRGQVFDRVLIMAPSHRAYFNGASVYSQGGYRTPLGVVPLDRHLIGALSRYEELVSYVPQAEAQEHSLEIQLPFLQVVLKEFQLTPILIGDQSYGFCARLAEAISDICQDSNILLIASSDLSHYHPYLQAKELDQSVLDRVASFDPDGLSEDLNAGKCEACGAGPMITLMLAAKKLGANKSLVLHYANSGDVTGDTRGVVGYMAAAFIDNPGDKRSRHKIGVDLGLSEDEKQNLRDIASQAIYSHCLGQKPPDVTVISPKLKEHRGAFVCIHKGVDLRGCIGMIEGRAPLHETIRDMAVQAAFHDPRFCPLDSSELDDISVEISVLTPLEQIKEPSEIEIGKHGILIRQGFHSGLLLPQVATEHGWDQTQFLEWTCKKAGIRLDAWKSPDAHIYRFSADVF